MSFLKKLFGGGEDAPTAQPSKATHRKDASHIHLLTISGRLNKPTVDAFHKLAAADIKAGKGPLKILVLLRAFQGWKEGDIPADMELFSPCEADIAKIAVVGEERWRQDSLAFLGEGQRKGEVRYFGTQEEVAARQWLA